MTDFKVIQIIKHKINFKVMILTVYNPLTVDTRRIKMLILIQNIHNITKLVSEYLF